MIEAGALGLPGAFQDMCTYDGAELKFKSGDELIDLFKLMTKDFNTYNNFSKNGRKFAEGLWLEDHLEEVMALYFTSWGSKERNIMSPTLIKNNPEQKC